MRTAVRAIRTMEPWVFLRCLKESCLTHQEGVVLMAQTDFSWWRIVWRAGLVVGVVLVLFGAA